jgi:hypothetical protein
MWHDACKSQLRRLSGPEGQLSCVHALTRVEWMRRRRRSVFETNIRALGGLLSAHLLIEASARAAASGHHATQRKELMPGYDTTLVFSCF